MDTQDTKLHDQEAVHKLYDLIHEVKICMFTTLDENRDIISRPMLTASVDEHAHIWFFTNEYSEKIQEASGDNRVNLIYAHPGKNVYVNIKGSSTVIIDRKKIEELWNSSFRNWFPEGVNDPKLCLVKVTTESAYYWSHSASKVRLAANLLRSIARGDKYRENEKGSLSFDTNSPEML